MDQRIESFLGDVLALAGDEPDASLGRPTLPPLASRAIIELARRAIALF
jgi:hypothetical protein